MEFSFFGLELLSNFFLNNLLHMCHLNLFNFLLVIYISQCGKYIKVQGENV